MNSKVLPSEQARKGFNGIQGKQLGSPAEELNQANVSGAVEVLLEVFSNIDPYSASLGRRLCHAAEILMKSAGILFTWELKVAALLAEVGVLTIPIRVLIESQSGQEITEPEKKIISSVAERGAELLKRIPALAGVTEIIRYQNKNYDGSGSPENSVAGENIPHGARILKVLSHLFGLKENGYAHDLAIEEMKSKPGWYDEGLLQRAQQSLKESPSLTISGNRTALGLKELRPGQLLVANVLSDDENILIPEGQILSPKTLHKLRNFAFTAGVKEPIQIIDLLESPLELPIVTAVSG